MKKFLLGCLLISMCFLFAGCGKLSEKNIVNDLSKKIEKLDGYHITGELEIVNNEDSYVYNVEVSYAKENNFKVSLVNKTNNHEQIILRNSDGVYVLTPSLNKSFKFQSEWPYNNSQAYLLQTIIKDLKEDTNRTYEENNDEYVFTTKVNYSSNKNMEKQKIYLDKSLNIKKVEVLNSNDAIQMQMTFSSIDYNATYDTTYFALTGNTKTSSETQTTSGTIESITYPMYIPQNTFLTGQQKIDTDDGERVILTFKGDNPFMVIQETTNVSKDFLTIPMYGEPYNIADTVGALSEDSITWNSNGVDYYVVSSSLETNELLEIANSISIQSVAKQ